MRFFDFKSIVNYNRNMLKKLLQIINSLIFCSKQAKKRTILSKSQQRDTNVPLCFKKPKRNPATGLAGIPVHVFEKPKRKVNKVFIHCSDSDSPKYDLEAIRKDHLAKRWKDIGYHYFIDQKGIVHKARQLERIPASQAPYNTNSISICVAGRHVFTEKALESLQRLCSKINNAYREIKFFGHCEVNKSKTCPNFDYREVLNLNLNGIMGGLW